MASDIPSEKPERELSLDTLVVQSALHDMVEKAKPLVQPIVPSVGYTHPTLLDMDQAFSYQGGLTPNDPNSYVYFRYAAPNPSALEEALAMLEGAPGAVSFGSGMAALHAGMLALINPGETLLAADQLYGTTRTMLELAAATMGLRIHYVDILNANVVRSAVEAMRPSCLLCEVMTNPLVRVAPLSEIIRVAHDAGAKVLVDNTFATPFLLRPLEYGADMVVHSTTKFLNGHGDVLGGVALGSEDLMQKLYQHRRVLGGVPSAFDAWLSLRGLRTFAVRMRQACSSAQKIAGWLSAHQKVGNVYYPGLPGDSGHETARSLFRPGWFGAMIAFEVKGLDRSGAFSLVESLQLIKPVTSLGDIYTLIMHPASTSHRTLTAEQRETQGITEGILRLSIGIEGTEDLISDLQQALEKV